MMNVDRKTSQHKQRERGTDVLIFYMRSKAICIMRYAFSANPISSCFVYKVERRCGLAGKVTAMRGDLGLISTS
jgi:hypothetical protein